MRTPPVGARQARRGRVGAPRAGVFIVAAVRDLATQLLGHTDLGSPHGVTGQDHWVRQLWHITYIFAVPDRGDRPGGILWCVFRYRVNGPGSTPAGRPVPVPHPHRGWPTPSSRSIIVAIVFGFMLQRREPRRQGRPRTRPSRSPSRASSGAGVSSTRTGTRRSAPSPTSSTSTPKPTCPSCTCPPARRCSSTW